VLLRRDNFTYLGIQEGPQTCLALAWSFKSEVSDWQMLTVQALECLVGSKEVADYRISADASRNFAFILCPDDIKAENLRGRFVKVGDVSIFFDLIANAGYLPFGEDVNQHPKVVKKY